MYDTRYEDPHVIQTSIQVCKNIVRGWPRLVGSTTQLDYFSSYKLSTSSTNIVAHNNRQVVQKNTNTSVVSILKKTI